MWRGAIVSKRQQPKALIWHSLFKPLLAFYEYLPSGGCLDPLLPSNISTPEKRGGLNGSVQTGSKSTRRSFKTQGLSRPLIQTQGYFVQADLLIPENLSIKFMESADSHCHLSQRATHSATRRACC